jgi:hypothetical protein
MASTYYQGMYSSDEAKLPVLVKKKSDLSDSDFDKNLKAFMQDSDLVCNNIVWRERSYKEGLVVVISRKDQLEMTVGVIKSILVKSQEIYLVVRRSNVVQTYLKVFKTESVEDRLVFVNIKNLKDTYPLLKRGSDEKYYIIPHHHISFAYE